MAGQQFGPYRMDGLLGRGGMGEVYRAYDMVRQRYVALKVLPEQLAGDREFRARFKREAELLTRLRAPHVVPVNAFGEIDGRMYLDMALLEGLDLDKVLVTGPLSADRAVRVIGQLAMALDAAHAAGLVHRDVKPSNVLLTTVDGADFAYLLDFGIARSMSGTTGLTSTGMAIGTLDYMPPERFASGRADARSDVYSLACLFYECLTGAKPFATGDLAALIGAHLSAPPPRPTERRPDLPPGFDTVVLTGMAKEPGDRYGGAGELATAAYRALAGQPLPPPPIAAPPLPIPPGPAPTGVWRNPAPPRRRSSAPLVLATVVALLAGITITSIVLLSNRSAANANSGTSVTSTTTTTTPTSITTTTTPTTTTTTPTTTTTTTTPPRQSGPSAIGTVQFGRCNDPGVRSHVSNRGNFLNVVNNSSQPVYFNWLDLNGVWQRHSYVAPNMPGQVQTDQGTWWVATDAAATCIALFQGGGQLVIQ